MSAAPAAAMSCESPKVEADGECLLICDREANKVTPEEPCACYNPDLTTYVKISKGYYCYQGARTGPLVKDGEKVLLDGSACTKEPLVLCNKDQYCASSKCVDHCVGGLNTIQKAYCACWNTNQSKANIVAPGQVCHEEVVYSEQQIAKTASDKDFCAGKKANKLCAEGQYCVDGECYDAIPNCPSGVIQRSICKCGEDDCYAGNSCVNSKCQCAENVLLPKVNASCNCGNEECNYATSDMCVNGQCVLMLPSGQYNKTSKLQYCASSTLSFVYPGQYCLDGQALDDPACEFELVNDCQCFLGEDGYCPAEGGKQCDPKIKQCLPECLVSDDPIEATCTCKHFYKTRMGWSGGNPVILEAGDFCVPHPDRSEEETYTRAIPVCSATRNPKDASLSCHCGPTKEPCSADQSCQNKTCVAKQLCKADAVVEAPFCFMPKDLSIFCFKGHYVSVDYVCCCPENEPFIGDIQGCYCGGGLKNPTTNLPWICQPKTQVAKSVHLPICQQTDIEPEKCWCEYKPKRVVEQFGRCLEICSSSQTNVNLLCVDCPATCKTCNSELKCTSCKSSLKGGEECSYKSGLLAAIIVPCVVVLLAVIGVATWLVLRRRPVAKVDVTEAEQKNAEPQVAAQGAAEN